MDEKTRKQITDSYENHIRDWFEEFSFASQRLDKPGSKQGKSADWKFTKGDLTVLCEVKTIFSGSQSGCTSEQHDRRRLEIKRKFDYNKAQAIAEGSTLITHKDTLDFIEGRVPYPKQTIRKEEAFEEFVTDVCSQLETDEDIKHLPFSVSISVNAMYIAYGEERKWFIDRLKEFVLWANEHHSDLQHSKRTFQFRPYQKAKDGKIQRSIEAFVQILGPWYPQLEVGFFRGGNNFNEDGIAASIEDAISQLKASISKEKASNVLPVVAFWSERVLKKGGM